MNTSSSVVFIALLMPEFRVIQLPILNFKLASLLFPEEGRSLLITPQKHYTHALLGGYSPRSMFVFSFFLVSITFLPEPSGSLMHTVVKGSVGTDTMSLMKYVLLRDVIILLCLQLVAVVLQNSLICKWVLHC